MIVIHEQHNVIFYLNRKHFRVVFEFIEVFEGVVFEKVCWRGVGGEFTPPPTSHFHSINNAVSARPTPIL